MNDLMILNSSKKVFEIDEIESLDVDYPNQFTLYENLYKIIKGENNVNAKNRDKGINQIIFPSLHLWYDNCAKMPITKHINMEPVMVKSWINPLKAVYIFEYPFGEEIF